MKEKVKDTEVKEELLEEANNELIEEQSTKEIEQTETEEDTKKESIVEELPEINVKEKPKTTKKKQEEPRVDKDFTVEELSDEDPKKVINKTHVAYLKYKKGESVWFCNFCGEIERGKTIFNKLENKYKFRPKYAKIYNVLINEFLEPMYQFEGISGYHTEDKLFNTEQECTDYCNKLN